MWPFGPAPSKQEQYVGADADLRPRARTWLEYAKTVLGGYPGPVALTTSPSLAEERERLRAEKVNSGPPGIKMPWLAPYIDDHTAEPAAARAAYRRMWADPNVKAALLSKVFNVAALDLEVHAAGNGRKKEDREAADFTRYCLTEAVEGGWPGAVWSVLGGGLPDGYSVNEKVYGPERGGRWSAKWALHALRPKDVGNDVVLQTDRFKQVVSVRGLRYNAGEEFSPGLFWIWRNLPLYDSPVGMSDLRAAYGSWWMLDTVRRLRILAADKNALPFLVGTYPLPGTHIKPTLDEMLANVKSRNWASVPEGTKIDALNIAGSAADIYAAFTRDLQHEIVRSICLASLPQIEGTVEDGRGDTRTSKMITDRASWWLARSLESSLNDRRTGLVKEMVDLNFVVSEYPTVSLSGVDPVELGRELDIDERLLAMGMQLSKGSLYERYGRAAPAPGEGLDVLGGPAQQEQGPLDLQAPGDPQAPPQPQERFNERRCRRKGGRRVIRATRRT